MAVEKQKRETEVKILQNQLTPHFLYNSLNSVRWMAILQKQDNIKQFVDALNNLLNYSLRQTNETATLREEIAAMSDYVRIQKVRYRNFTFQVEVEEALWEAQILKFLLQPLLENALIYGLLKTDAPGVITLRGKAAEGGMYLSVLDNGKGMNSARLDEVREWMHAENGEHIGLRNVCERIRLYYGSAYGCWIESVENSGTTVSLMLPLEIQKIEKEKPI